MALPSYPARELAQFGVVEKRAPVVVAPAVEYVAWKPTPEQKEPPF
jgi:hypothetical protein